MADKPIVYTHHAEHAMAERDIAQAWVEATVKAPDWVLPDETTIGAERRYRSIADRGNRILRVACLESDDHIRIITAFFDRKARRAT
ncbi:DUF4258 domain-containing protein [Rhizobium sp. EC-SD404]|uniref:DUF4258 domain-containing protein n=1 Tax=Rhizobium sp. EC-SD404 TaxID=2038389 RepID=UPI00125F36A4|nr:DUF4258 domain-containing protein [Rhizobium sp. EC-SD404]